MGYDSARSRSAPEREIKKPKTRKSRYTQERSGKIIKKKTTLKLISTNKNSLEKNLNNFFEKNIFFIAYMNHVLYYNNKNFDKELTSEQIEQVKRFFNSKNEMELAIVLPIITILYNKYYTFDKNSIGIKRLFKIFKMDKALDEFMIFILKKNSDIREIEGGIPPKITAMLYIAFYTISLLLLTYVVNISKNSTIKDILENSNYINNIYKNSQKCDINPTHNSNNELLKRTINYLGLNNRDVGILHNFMKSIECFNDRDFEKAVVNELFELEDFAKINEDVPNDMALVRSNNKNSIVATSNDNTALVPANYKFDEITKRQIVTYVRNGITDPVKIQNLLNEINENPDKPVSEKTYYELMYDTVIKNINEKNIAAVLTGNTNYFMKKIDDSIDMIQDTIAKYNIASIKARRITEKVTTKTTRGYYSFVYLVMLIWTWYGYATYSTSKIYLNINLLRRLAIEERARNQMIQNQANLAIGNNR
jgi:predicted house-cleaning noncanonical NTP pyrophosphatase (MazG superfamily)